MTADAFDLDALIERYPLPWTLDEVPPDEWAGDEALYRVYDRRGDTVDSMLPEAMARLLIASPDMVQAIKEQLSRGHASGCGVWQGGLGGGPCTCGYAALKESLP